MAALKIPQAHYCQKWDAIKISTVGGMHMKNKFLFYCLFLLTATAYAQQNDSDDNEPLGLCVTASIEVKGYVTSDCSNVKTLAQDRCAATSIRVKGYVTSDCLTLQFGGRCAVESLKIKKYLTSDCANMKTDAQDRCAATSIRVKGYVTLDCLSL